MPEKNNLALVIVGALIVIGAFFIIINDYKEKKAALDSSTQSVRVTYSSHLSRSTNRHHRHHSSKRTYAAQYHYVVDGQTYICEDGSSSSSKPSNKPKTIYYNSHNPHECLVDNGAMNSLLSLF